MSYDLRTASWIPWLRRRAGLQWGPIAELTADLRGSDPVIGIAAPRADFQGALLEFLIGVLTASLRPADEQEWLAAWTTPPTPEALQSSLDTLPNAFFLGPDDEPQFLQDFVPADLAEYSVLPLDRLAIDSPGEQSIGHNKTLFVKPGRFEMASRPVAAMALITMQTYAPAGGQGNRTSMRGGGPLTTLADPRQAGPTFSADEAPLWQKLWINVETAEQLDARSPSGPPPKPALIFPWVSATRTSDASLPPVTPLEAHALQAYFGMPRRIRLMFGDAGTCDLTGMHDDVTIRGYRMRNYGVEYSGWTHPLSPHYLKQDKDGASWLPVHPQPGGITWRDWPDIALAPEGSSRQPAACVTAALARAKVLRLPSVRLHAFGFDMDNMKARAWISAMQPVFVLPEDTIRTPRWLPDIATELVRATRAAELSLTMAVKQAMFDRPGDAGGDALVPRQQLWAQTDAAFFGILRDLIAADFGDDAVTGALKHYYALVRETTLRLFDDAAPLASVPVTALRRHVGARYALSGFFNGYGKLGRQLYESLQMVVPVAAKKVTRTQTRKKGASA